MKDVIEKRIAELKESKAQHIMAAQQSQANANACEGAIIELTALLIPTEKEDGESK